MPYVYANARSLPGLPKVGDQECVALVRFYTHAPPARSWRQGKPVLGDDTLRVGTAIATFEHGRWPGHSHGNHAAFYVGQDPKGIWVVDQWTTNGRSTITRRLIRVKPRRPDGSYVQPSDNAAAFSVIE